ncbi:hypothetical protein DFR29_107253 [Tahibacter aquaticus]|uniref:Tetratricopeptide repeat protein n=1 Tax=Tahibacter aquaticus TaxID=520092 RepID=A0A4R6YWM3_9GAMM|nr:DUF4013 domain-containing protein [Tahibacter aquaticus]TDR43240.1 hypothetical protein DFR29_107253 [Tahibacter aquaticus]
MNDQAIVPFWQRLREITLYPAQSAALMVIAGLALLRLLSLLPLIGWVINIALTIGLYKFAFEVLRATANGRMEPPEGMMEVDQSIGWMGIWLQVIFIVMGFVLLIVFGVMGLGWLGLALCVVMMFGYPGAVMSLAIDENLGHALSPPTWLQIMARLGWPYFVAFGLMLVIFISAGNAQAWLSNILPLVIGLPVFHFISGYALIATFHLMGYLIWQYHEELGYTPDKPLKLARASDDPDQFILDESAEMVRDGETDMATEALRAHLRERGGTEKVHQQYRKLLKLKGDSAEMLRHGKEYLPILLAQDKEKAAVELYRELSELEPAFIPTDAESNVRLARRAALLGHAQVALRLVNGFHKRHPRSSDIPQMYLMAAQLLSERMGKDAEAKALLTQIRTAYPNHELVPEIDNLLKLIDSVSAGRKPAPG